MSYRDPLESALLQGSSCLGWPAAHSHELTGGAVLPLARNRVKEGVSFATYGTSEEMGIRFTTFSPEGGVLVTASAGVGLADVVEALQMSERLHRAIASRAEEASGLTSG